MLRLGDRLIRNEIRFGLAGNHNKCIELARGTRFQFVHADDWSLPGVLQRLAPCFDDPAVVSGPGMSLSLKTLARALIQEFAPCAPVGCAAFAALETVIDRPGFEFYTVAQYAGVF
jgi:Glycosyl transferase family 2